MSEQAPLDDIIQQIIENVNRGNRGAAILNLSNALVVAKHQAWDEGWDLGNEYAISEPFDDRAAKSKNPWAVQS